MKQVKMPEAVEMRALDALLPYARNARTHSDAQVAQIAASIVEFGWTNPVLVDDGGTIIAGHGRVLAARKLGLVDVPCIVLSHLTDAQRRALVIADNRLALSAGWDDEMLASELIGLRDDGFSVPLLGFDETEVALMLGGVDANDGKMPPLPPEPAAKQLVFVLTPDQRERVDAALERSTSANKNDALVEVCDAFCS